MTTEDRFTSRPMLGKMPAPHVEGGTKWPSRKGIEGARKKASMSNRRRGSGSIYKQPGCTTWTIKFYQTGKCIREATGLTDYQAARQKLNQRLGKMASGEVVDTRLDRVMVAELAEETLRDYRINGRKSLADAEARWRLHLGPAFGHFRAIAVTTRSLSQYVDERKQQGAENATINRELAFLKRAFNLGFRSTPPKVQFVPAFPHLKENPPRKGFIDEAQYSQLARNADELWLRALLALAFNFGFRRDELLSLRVRQFDALRGTLLLDPGSTKSGEGRSVVLTRECSQLLEACVHGKQPDDFILTREGHGVVKDFRDTWKNLCERSGFSGLLLHDTRRSAVRRMIRSGIPERVAMDISGHKTRSIFDRYNITSQSDLKEAARKLERVSEFGHDFGHDLPKNGAVAIVAKSERMA